MEYRGAEVQERNAGPDAGAAPGGAGRHADELRAAARKAIGAGSPQAEALAAGRGFGIGRIAARHADLPLYVHKMDPGKTRAIHRPGRNLTWPRHRPRPAQDEIQ